MFFENTLEGSLCFYPLQSWRHRNDKWFVNWIRRKFTCIIEIFFIVRILFSTSVIKSIDTYFSPLASFSILYGYPSAVVIKRSTLHLRIRGDMEEMFRLVSLSPFSLIWDYQLKRKTILFPIKSNWSLKCWTPVECLSKHWNWNLAMHISADNFLCTEIQVFLVIS